MEKLIKWIRRPDKNRITKRRHELKQFVRHEMQEMKQRDNSQKKVKLLCIYLHTNWQIHRIFIPGEIQQASECAWNRWNSRMETILSGSPFMCLATSWQRTFPAENQRTQSHHCAYFSHCTSPNNRQWTIPTIKMIPVRPNSSVISYFAIVLACNWLVQ